MRSGLPWFSLVYSGSVRNWRRWARGGKLPGADFCAALAMDWIAGRWRGDRARFDECAGVRFMRAGIARKRRAVMEAKGIIQQKQKAT